MHPLGQNCSQIIGTCATSPGDHPAPNTTTTITLTQQPDGEWSVTDHNCAAPIGTGNPAPAGPSPADIQAEIQRRVPRPAVGVAPPGGTTLVNIETLLWVDTPPDRQLGTANLVGHDVTLAVGISSVRWTFGDGSTATAANPGHPYDESAVPCHTKLCSSYYFGHVYTRPGHYGISAEVVWQGRYRIGDGAWQDIPQTVTGPPARVEVTVKEARSVLVPDPSR